VTGSRGQGSKASGWAVPRSLWTAKRSGNVPQPQSIESLAKEWQIARATVRDILGRGRVAKNLAASGDASC